MYSHNLQNPNKEVKESQEWKVQLDWQGKIFNEVEEGKDVKNKPGMELDWLEFLDELFNKQAM
jgi:hypothetical protein